MDSQLQLIQQKVTDLLSQDQSGHGVEHVNHVLRLSRQFAQQENADIRLATIIALLHDVDDYKLFGRQGATDLPHAKQIMSEAGVDAKTQALVCDEIHHIGYSKRLQGIQPQTLEGKIVSDADMCEGLGVAGILRTYQYSSSHNCPFFHKDAQPNPRYDPQKYIASNQSNTGIDHFFEKILRLKNLMLTPSGKLEAASRHDFSVKFLRQLFQEEGAGTWLAYLEDFLQQNP